MNSMPRFVAAAALVCTAGMACSDDPKTTAEVMESLQASDWRTPEPENLMVMQLANGVVVMELAPGFAPETVANIKTLVHEEYFDGLAIIRSQDNYVVQWADPAEDESQAKSIGSAAATVSAEFQRSSEDIQITAIESRDAYAEIVGFTDGFPAGSDGRHAWLAHCYGMVGVARGNETNSGNGTSLYVITGHAPRHLDRNITLVGRVLSGIELLSVLPRGTGPLGFYESADEYTPITTVRMGNALEAKEHVQIEVLRTDTEAFSDYVAARTSRNEEWFVEPTGRIELCNISPPARSTD